MPEQDAWIKKKAQREQGSAGMTKYVLSDEQRRIERLRSVKSSVGGLMKVKLKSPKMALAL